MSKLLQSRWRTIGSPRNGARVGLPFVTRGSTTFGQNSFLPDLVVGFLSVHSDLRQSAIHVPMYLALIQSEHSEHLCSNSVNKDSLRRQLVKVSAQLLNPSSTLQRKET